LDEQGVYSRGLVGRYDWKPILAAVRRWVKDRGCGCIEVRVGDVDTEFGTRHLSPRASTLLVNASHGGEASFFLLLKPAGVRADMRTIRRAIDADSARLASHAEIHATTQCRPGCLPPIGDLFDFPLLIDSRLASVGEIFVPSGQPGFTILVRTRDLLRMGSVRVVSEMQD
jgi:prolyl-tRNA editing enzyme YbaK/EbsC (Cys-tRNA(Pro) deacylase)